MKIRGLLIVAAFGVALLALPGRAAAGEVYCPPTLTGDFTHVYMVNTTPNSTCLDWQQGTDDSNIGNGTVGASTGDPFLDEPANDVGGTWVLIEKTECAGSNPCNGNGTYLDTTNQNTSSGSFTVTPGSLTYTEYALGLKDGNAPQWAVFLLGALTGTWGIGDFESGTFVANGPGSLSHAVLYGRMAIQSTNQPLEVVPEPASLLLLGSGLAASAYRLRKKKQTTIA